MLFGYRYIPVHRDPCGSELARDGGGSDRHHPLTHCYREQARSHRVTYRLKPWLRSHPHD
nr:hypothetical protein C1892_26930 [Pseudomonas sp. MPBD7-1]